jgi:hypothetical protein
VDYKKQYLLYAIFYNSSQYSPSFFIQKQRKKITEMSISDADAQVIVDIIPVCL